MRVFAILSALAVFALANPAPLGFEIDKATYDEVTAKYRVESSFRYKTGEMSVYINKKNVELDDLTTNVMLYFNVQGRLVETQIGFNKNKFNELLSSFSKKYKLVEKTTDKSGEIYVEFEVDNCNISLRLLKEITSLTYTSKDEIKKRKKEHEEAVKKENERKQRTKENMKSL